jgi:hypothetical protein
MAAKRLRVQPPCCFLSRWTSISSGSLLPNQRLPRRRQFRTAARRRIEGGLAPNLAITKRSFNAMLGEHRAN